MKGILSLRLLLGFTLLLLAPLVMLFLPGVTWSAAINVSVNVQPFRLAVDQNNLFLPLLKKPFAQTLTNDFTPCVGHPSGQVTTPQRSLALIAYSANGVDFSRPTDPSERIVIDEAGVPDAVVLPSGRILVYYMNGCKPQEDVINDRSGVAVAVSDYQGAPGSWVYKNVKFVNLPTDGFGIAPMDSNVVLMPDGSLRMFATVFHLVGGSMQGGAFSFHSTDGGFTYYFEGLRYDGIADPENYRFSDSNWQIFTGGPIGNAMSTDGGNIFSTLGPSPVDPHVIHEIAVTDTPGTYRAYVSTPNGIKSYSSAAAPWTTWTEEPGYRLQLDTTSGMETCEVAVPSVLRLGLGKYLMVYLSVYPGCGCSEDPICS